MGYKDLHDEPFDESTIFKLEIFEDYAQAWIPTFVMQPHISEIHIFAGVVGIFGQCIGIFHPAADKKYNFQQSLRMGWSRHIQIQSHFAKYYVCDL